jgi:hypothetical protein
MDGSIACDASMEGALGGDVLIGNGTFGGDVPMVSGRLGCEALIVGCRLGCEALIVGCKLGCEALIVGCRLGSDPLGPFEGGVIDGRSEFASSRWWFELVYERRREPSAGD